MGQLLNINDIKKLYPDEWVLIGNPVMDDTKIDVLSGISNLSQQGSKRSLLHRQG